MATTIGTAYVQVKPDPRSISEFQRAVQSRIGAIKLNVDQSRGAFAPLGKISADLNQFQNSLDASVARTLAFGASVGVIGGTVRSIRAVISSFIEVEKSIADINAVFKLTSPELKGFTSDLFDVARSTAQSFKDVATAATEFSRQGLSVGETLKRTESAMKLVRLAGLDTTQAVNVLTAAMNGFSSAGLESVEIVNKLATVDAAYAVSSSDLALALSRAGDTAQGAKVSFDELLGAVTAVQQRTARGGAVIGNGLKSIFTRLQRSRVQGALEDVGVATKDADGNIRESMSILKDYAAVYNTLSDSQRAYTDEQIAGVYQINTLKALVKDLTNEYGVYNGAVRTSTEATDEAEKRMAALSQTTEAKLKRVSASFAEFSSLGGKDIFSPIISFLSKVTDTALGGINSALSSESKGFGSSIISGLTQGLGNFLAGPGLIVGIKTAIKLVGFLGKEAYAAAQQVSQIGTQSQKRLQSQQALLGLLQNDSALVAQIAAGTLNAANANRLIENSLTKQLQLSERIASFQKNVGAFVASNPAIIASHAAQLGGKTRRFAGGYAPALQNEKRAISQGVGGARSGDKPVVIPEFNYGGGKRGPAVAHTGEWFVPHFNGGNAIFNRDMAESYGLPSGAVRVGMAEGHIPSFAGIRQQMLPGFTSAGKSASASGSSGFHSGLNIGEINEAVASISRPKELRKFLNSLGLRGSKGSSRAWYGLGGGRGVKVPFNEAGMAQSEVENRILFEDYFAAQQYSDILPKSYVVNHESGAAILESLNSARANDFKRLTGLNKSRFLSGRHGGEYGRFGSYEYSGRPKRGSESNFVRLADDFLGNYGLLGADFVGGRNIGLSADDKLKLLDIGYSDDVKRRFYTNRNLGRGVAGGYVPNFVDFRSSRPTRGDKGLRIQYRLGDKIPAGQDPRVDMLRDDPYIGRIDKTFKNLGLPEPKASIRDFLIDYDSAGKLSSSTGGGVYYPSSGESIIARQGSKARDFLGTVGHEVGGHHLDWSFKDSKRGRALGIEGPISDDPRFVAKFNRAYKSWQKHGPDAKISPILKHTFSRVEGSPEFYPTKRSMRREVFADMAQFLYGRKSGPKAKRTAIGGLMSSITGANTFSSGYDPLAQAVSRESDAVGSGKVRIGTHPSLKAPHNPMGIGVYNSSEGSLSNGIRMARSAGMEPKTKGMAEGHVPHFAVDESGSYRTNKGRHALSKQEAQPLADAVERGVTKAMISSTNQRAGKPRNKMPDPPLYQEQQEAIRGDVGTANLRRTFANRDAIDAADRAIRNSYSPAPRGPSTAGGDSAATFHQNWAARSARPTGDRAGKIDRFFNGLQKRRSLEGISENNIAAATPKGLLETVRTSSLYQGARDKTSKGFKRAFSYTDEERAAGKGGGRFGFAFGGQIAGGIARSASQGTSAEKAVGALADGLDVAATAATLLPGPFGLAAAAVGGTTAALYKLAADDGADKLSASLERNALEANRSAQALADVTQSYTAYESAISSRDPARMSAALEKLTSKIFKIGEFDPTSMQSALSAIASGDPREGLASAQSAVAERQAGFDRVNQLFQATKQSSGFLNLGGLGKGGVADSAISFKQGVTGEQATAAVGKANRLIFKENDIAGGLKALEEVIDGGAQAINAILEGGFGGDIGGVTAGDKQLGAMQIAGALGGKVSPLRQSDDFVSVMKGPMEETARTQKELAVASRTFGFELAKASANVQIFSESATRGFEATMAFRDSEFSSSLGVLQDSGRITEREAINVQGFRGAENILTTHEVTRNKLGADARVGGIDLANSFLKGEGGTARGAGAINSLYSKADTLSREGNVEGLKELFSEASINSLGLGSEEGAEAIASKIQESGSEMIAKLGVLEADTKRMLDLNAKQVEFQAKLYDANLYMKTIWGKGGTQKGTNEITEAIRRIEMARSKDNLTVNQRERLATDLDVVKSESGIDYDAKLAKFNKESLNASLAENMFAGNVNDFGGQMTASTQEQIDKKIDMLGNYASEGSGGSGADFAKRYLEAKTKGEAALGGLEEGAFSGPDLTLVNDGFQAIRTESDKLAAAFEILAQKSDVAKEARLNEKMTMQDKLRSNQYDTKLATKARQQGDFTKKEAELREKLADPNTARGSDYTVNAKGEATNDNIEAVKDAIKALYADRDTAAANETAALSKELIVALTRVAEAVKDPASVGRASSSTAEINMAIRATLAETTFSKEVEEALRATLEEKSRAIMDDKARSLIKSFARS